jgi:hypothetical protein
MPTSDPHAQTVVTLAELWPLVELWPRLYRIALRCSCGYKARGQTWERTGRLMDEHLWEVLRETWGKTDKET